MDPRGQSTVCIGDQIFLCATKGSGYLWGDGVYQDTVSLWEDPEDYEDCVFQIWIRSRVAAAVELQEYVTATVRRKQDLMDDLFEEADVQDEVLKALERSKHNEDKQNEKLMTDDGGSKLSYGDTIQLRHLKSGGFITASRETTAKENGANLELVLTQHGGNLAWFTILPATAANILGDPVEDLCRVILSASEHPDEYLFCSKDPTDIDICEGAFREVSISLDQSAWELRVFNKYCPVNKDMPLRIGDYVYLKDPEANAAVRALTKAERDRWNKKCHWLRKTHQSHDRPFQLPSVVVDFSSAQEEGGDDDGERQFDSNAIWVVKNAHDLAAGGLMYLKKSAEGPMYALQHMATGGYLAGKICSTNIPNATTNS
jgi:hypothetical protein